MDPQRALRQAVSRRDVGRAVDAAQALRPLSLLDALEVVTLLGETSDPRYDSWADRWTRRVAAEHHLQPDAVAQIRRLLKLLPSQNEARAVTAALAAYARPPRTWS